MHTCTLGCHAKTHTYSHPLPKRQLAKSAATTFANLARVEAYRLHLVSVGAIEAIATILERGLIDGKRCVHAYAYAEERERDYGEGS